MKYQSLTPAQVEQVRFLFADELIGTDPRGYEYEIQGEEVIARIANDQHTTKVHIRKAHTVTMKVAVMDLPDQFVTVEMSRSARVTVNEIARSVLENVRARKLEEVNP